MFRNSLNRDCVAVILAGGSGSSENLLSSSRSLAAMEVVRTLTSLQQYIILDLLCAILNWPSKFSSTLVLIVWQSLGAADRNC